MLARVNCTVSMMVMVEDTVGLRRLLLLRRCITVVEQVGRLLIRVARRCSPRQLFAGGSWCRRGGAVCGRWTGVVVEGSQRVCQQTDVVVRRSQRLDLGQARGDVADPGCRCCRGRSCNQVRNQRYSLTQIMELYKHSDISNSNIPVIF